jgi:hypothetical protein
VRSADQVLGSQEDGQSEALGVGAAGLGGVDHDPEVVARDDEHVAVHADAPDGPTGTFQEDDGELGW